VEAGKVFEECAWHVKSKSDAIEIRKDSLGSLIQKEGKEFTQKEEK